MESNEFKTLLFEVACCAVACDYDIDEREVRELQYINKSTTYFKDIDLSKQLESFLAKFKGNEAKTINELIEKVKNSSLSPVEELLILEVALRLIYADVKIDEKEIDFLKSVHMALSLSDKMIIDRFGPIEFLINQQRTIKPSSEKVDKKYDLDSHDLKSIEKMYFNTDEDRNQTV
jgi:hypothetical protein